MFLKEISGITLVSGGFRNWFLSVVCLSGGVEAQKNEQQQGESP